MGLQQGCPIYLKLRRGFAAECCLPSSASGTYAQGLRLVQGVRIQTDYTGEQKKQWELSYLKRLKHQKLLRSDPKPGFSFPPELIKHSSFTHTHLYNFHLAPIAHMTESEERGRRVILELPSGLN